MIIAVDPSLPLPAYEQIREQIVRMVASGVLPVGARLPTIRQLAADLGLAKGTVARTYELLESESVIETRGRSGTYVSTPPVLPAAERLAALDHLVESAVVAARQLGATQDEVEASVRRVWSAL